MTAAIAHSLPTAVRFARTRARARLEHIALVLGICLPVPLLALTGLSIPLPSSVERLAASLVPWAESSTLDASGAARGAGGSIIRTADEGGSQEQGSGRSLDARAATTAARGSKPAAAKPGAPGARTRPGVTPDDKTTAPADTTTPGESREETTSGGAADSPVQPPSVERPGTRQEAPPPPGPPPPPPSIAPPPPPPIAGIVEDTTTAVRDTTRPIVDNVGNTVDNATKPVIGVQPVEAVKGAIPIGRK
jgi:hypothetical protein